MTDVYKRMTYGIRRSPFGMSFFLFFVGDRECTYYLSAGSISVFFHFFVGMLMYLFPPFSFFPSPLPLFFVMVFRIEIVMILSEELMTFVLFRIHVLVILLCVITPIGMF